MKRLKLIFTYLLLLLAATAITTSCGDSGGDEPPAPVSRTVLVYMIADNSLGKAGYDKLDLDEMLEGAKSGGLNGGRLLVYHNRRGTEGGLAPQLLEVTANGINTLKTYPDDPEIYSVDVERMRQVLSDSRSYAPAADYGLVLWSHGSGWKEASSSRNIAESEIVSAPEVHDFGEDRGVTMKVSSLSKALKGYDFSFIYFDCCFMATVEVIWELRDAAPVIVGSGIELPVNGMPYHTNLSAFFATGKPDLVKAARNTFEYYNSRNDVDRTCAMTVVNTAALPELADVSRRIFARVTDFSTDLRYIQRYERPGFINTIYDFEEYIEKVCDDSALLAEWKQAMADVVVYADHTPTVFYELALDRYCGLGSFVIMDKTDITFRNYNRQAWYTDVVSASPVLK